MGKIIKFKRELWIGILGITAILTVYLLINFFKGIDIFNDGNKYYVNFSNIGEVANSSPVFINGYKVGHVSNIIYDFADAKEVCVELTVDNRLKVPEDSEALISNKLLGSSVISLVLGKSEKYVESGDTIGGHLNGGVMDEASKMIPQITAMMPKLDSILVSLNTILGNPAIVNSTNNIERLTEELNKTTDIVNQLLKNDISVAADKLVKIEDDILKVSTQLTEFDYANIVASLESSLKNIESITTQLNNGEGTVGMLLKDSTLYDKLDATCGAANALLEDLKENPKRYVHFSIFGRKDKEKK